MRAVQLVALASIFAAGDAGSITSCGSASDLLSNVEVSLSPDPIVKGESFTFDLSGDLREDLAGLVVDTDLDAKVSIISRHISTQISLQSPVPKGPLKLTVGPINLASHPGSAAVTGTIRIKDSKGVAVACLKLDMNVPLLASSMLGSAKSCGKPSDHAKDFSITETSNDVTTITGTMDEALTDFTVHVDMTLKQWFVKIPISFHTKIHYTPGLFKGPFKIVIATLDDALSSELGVEAYGTVKLDDANAEEIACVVFNEDGMNRRNGTTITV